MRFHELILRAEMAMKVISPMSPMRLYITASKAELLASLRVDHHLISRKERKPTPSQPKKIKNRLFEHVRINIFNKKIVNSRKKAFFLGSSAI